MFYTITEPRHQITGRHLLQMSNLDASGLVISNDAFFDACRNGELEVVKFLCSLVDPTKNNNYAFREASREGHLEVVKFLSSLPGVDPAADYNSAARWACALGHLEVVKFLSSLPGVDFNCEPSNDASALWWAVYRGRFEVVKFLFTLPGMDVNSVFSTACVHGHLRIIRFFCSLPGVHLNVYAMQTAYSFSYTHVVKFLLPLVKDSIQKPEKFMKRVWLEVIEDRVLAGHVERLLENAGMPHDLAKTITEY